MNIYRREQSIRQEQHDEIPRRVLFIVNRYVGNRVLQFPSRVFMLEFHDLLGGLLDAADWSFE